MTMGSAGTKINWIRLIWAKIMDAFEEGYEDWVEGYGLIDNPYSFEDELSEAVIWEKGWLAADKDNEPND